MSERYCPYCMTKMTGNFCPKCGLPADSYVEASNHLPCGTVLTGRYYIGRVLGEGGFGITYMGYDLTLQRKVAIKEYFPSVWASRYKDVSLEVTRNTSSEESFQKGKQRFILEARAMAMMNKQKEIADVIDFFESNGTAYIVMEFVDGITLKARVMSSGPIRPEELFPLMEPIMNALQAMHNANLIHRDISPDNLMIENGRLRLIDFGCAKENTVGDMTMTVMQKQGFSPVEQYQKRGQGPWTDVYALAATIYYCLTGRVPSQAVDRLMNDDVILPRDLGVNITKQQQDALMKGMAVRKEDRFQSAAQFRDALLYSQPVYQNTYPTGTNTNSAAGYSGNGSYKVLGADQGKKKLPKYVYIIIAAAAAVVIALAVVLIIVFGTGKEKSSEDSVNNDSVQESEAETAAETQAAAQEVSWEFDETTGVLTISGTGAMDDYDRTDDIPWYYYAEEIYSVVIEDGVTTIGKAAFYECSNLMQVTIPDSVTSIGAYAFCDCTSLTSINIPDTVTTIEEYAFEDCEDLESISLPASLTSLDYYTFFGCSSLLSVDIPSSVAGIGLGCFENCESLASVTIPASVRSIGDDAFSYCVSLIAVTVDSDSQYLVSVDGVVFSADMKTLYVYPGGSSAESYTIPDTVTAIAGGAFEGSWNLVELNIPASVSSIGDYAVAGGYKLQSINVSEDNEYFASVDGVLFTKDMTTLVLYPEDKADTSYTIPSTVTTIYGYAFYYTEFLETLVIPSSVTYIDYRGIRGCVLLSEIDYTGTQDQWDSISMDDTVDFGSAEIILEYEN